MATSPEVPRSGRRGAEAAAPGLAGGGIILNTAAEFPPEPLVVGAYGQSRLRERVPGVVTRTPLRQMTAPVLMAHWPPAGRSARAW
jgi:nucleotide-binding universal stress UspA family protein